MFGFAHTSALAMPRYNFFKPHVVTASNVNAPLDGPLASGVKLHGGKSRA